MQSDKHTDTHMLASSVRGRGCVRVRQHPALLLAGPVSRSSHKCIPQAGMEGPLAQRAPARKRAQILEVVGSGSSCSIRSSLDLNSCRNFSGEIPSGSVTVLITAQSETFLKILGLKKQRMAIRAKGCHKCKTTFTA